MRQMAFGRFVIRLQVTRGVRKSLNFKRN